MWAMALFARLAIDISTAGRWTPAVVPSVPAARQLPMSGSVKETVERDGPGHTDASGPRST